MLFRVGESENEACAREIHLLSLSSPVITKPHTVVSAVERRHHFPKFIARRESLPLWMIGQRASRGFQLVQAQCTAKQKG